jgi:hypothetical protein
MNWRSYRKTASPNARIGRKSPRVGPSALMSGSRSSAVSGRASRDVLVAAACHCRTVNLPTLAIEPVDSVPVPATGLVTNTLQSKCTNRSNSRMVGKLETEIASRLPVIRDDAEALSLYEAQ